MQRMRTVLVAAAIAATIALVSCSSAGAADDRTPGVPDGIDAPSHGEDPYVIGFDDGRVQVVTFGSSSCPPTATSFVNDGVALTISFDFVTTGNCTADSNPTTHTFAAETVGSPIPTLAHILFPQVNDDHTVEVVMDGRH